MALFCCSKCGCVEDTALCHYWSARLRRMPVSCSACDPAIGNWHGEFPRQSADGWAKDEHGMLIWNKSEVEDWLGTQIEVIKPNSLPPSAAADLSALDEVKAPGRLIAGA